MKGTLVNVATLGRQGRLVFKGWQWLLRFYRKGNEDKHCGVALLEMSQLPEQVILIKCSLVHCYLRIGQAGRGLLSNKKVFAWGEASTVTRCQSDLLFLEFQVTQKKGHIQNRGRNAKTLILFLATYPTFACQSEESKSLLKFPGLAHFSIFRELGVSQSGFADLVVN